jgi:hypothetical protein
MMYSHIDNCKIGLFEHKLQTHRLVSSYKGFLASATTPICETPKTYLGARTTLVTWLAI